VTSPSYEHDRLVVAAELATFTDGEATLGQLLWTLRRSGTLGQGYGLRRRLWAALRGLDASGVLLLTEPEPGEEAEWSALLLTDGPPEGDEAPGA
jgi:hypothetical protein